MNNFYGVLIVVGIHTFALILRHFEYIGELSMVGMFLASIFLGIITTFRRRLKSFDLKKLKGELYPETASINDQLSRTSQEELTKKLISQALKKLTKDSHNKNKIKINEALVCMKRGNFNPAKQIFNEMAEKAEKGDIAIAAESYRNLGAIAYLNNTQEGIKAYKRATELEPENLIGWSQLGHLKLRLGELNEAKEAYKNALNLANKGEGGEFIARNGLGNLYFRLGDFDRAEENYDACLELSKNLRDKTGEGIANGSLGNIYSQKKEYDKAEKFYRDSLDSHKKIDYKEGMAISYGNLAYIDRINWRFKNAEENFFKSLNIAEALSFKETCADQYSGLGTLYKQMKKPDKALRFYKKSLTVEKYLKRKNGIAQDYGNLGDFYQEQEEFKRAVVHYKQAIKHNIVLENKEYLNRNYQSLIKTYTKMGDLKNAEATKDCKSRGQSS